MNLASILCSDSSSRCKFANAQRGSGGTSWGEQVEAGGVAMWLVPMVLPRPVVVKIMMSKDISEKKSLFLPALVGPQL